MAATPRQDRVALAWGGKDMTLEELLALHAPPADAALSPQELVRFFWKYKGLVKERERANAYWSTTNDNLKHAYERLDEKEQELARANAIMQDDLQVGSQIQQALMPRDASALGAGFEVAVYHRQMTEVGGDYYDYYRVKDGSVATGVFDISGHGVSAALVMAWLKSQLAQAMGHSDSPAEILSQVNDVSYEFLREVKKYATVNFVVFGEDSLRYVCGGGFGLLLSGDQHTSIDKSQHFLGLRKKPYVEHSLPFKTGDVLALYTDGMVEAQDATGHDYTVRRVNALVEQHRERPVQEIVDVCVADYQAFRGRDSDDITLMVLRKVG